MNKVTNGTLNGQSDAMDKSKDWQLELLMEKIRSKGSQFKAFGEISKNVRMAMLDKRYALDSVEKSQHQKCLDTLQHFIKVTSLQSMIERLESLTRQLGLKFMVAPTGLDLFISSDMFYLEINLDQSGAVRDVKVNHEGKVEPQSCSELVACLSKGDFGDFTAQLEGFASIYQLNAEKKIKCKAFCALQSLESDLSTLAQLQTFMKEPFNLLHKSPVGILEKRRGGHPMKLTYFVSPYDLIDSEKCDIEPISVETVTSKSLGYSVTVCMEGSGAHKLQTTTLITVNRNHNGKNTPSFAALSSQNSASIPACFLLKLNKPMPMCVVLVKQIQQLTELEVTDLTTTHPLLSLIATHTSEGKMEAGSMRGMFVTLPDQHHCYFMTEHKNMEGVLMNSIPFTHPGHVSQILVILRQQALFNTIISSCVRPNSKQDFENMIMFEVSALSWTQISISMEHPIEETMATAEIDLSDISNLVCRIHTPGTPPPANTPDIASELATKVLNRCFSIPVTMRAVIQLWEKQAVRKNHFNGSENFNLALGSGDPGGSGGRGGGSLTDFGGLDMKIKQEPGNGGSMGSGMNLPIMSHQHQGIFLNESIMASANFPNFQTTDGSATVLTNMELTNILAGTSSTPNSTIEKSSSASSSSIKGQHKRKSNDDSWKGGSSKRKAGDDPEMLLETSSSDSTSRSTPLSQETCSEIPTPNSALGFHSDLEFPHLDPVELMGNSDKVGNEFDNPEELDVEELLASTAREHKVRKPREKSPAASPGHLLSDLGESATTNVSIMPIQSSPSLGFQQGNSGHERKTTIEIIPLVTTSSPTMSSSSLTITPITSSPSKSEERTKEKKSSKSRSDDRSKLEKKRKRKKEESPMGPPEKVPAKQDPLTKPISVSIKPAESPPLTMTPTSPNMIRKYSTSPTHNRSISSLSGKLSPNLMKSGLKSSSSSHHSPKHSPAHVPSSPKHSIPGISSPKSHGASPKHPSTSGSGKPSMSTLKNAANSPSSKSSSSSSDSKSKSSSKESSRDKEKKLSNFSANNKIKPSSVKLKQLDLTITTPDLSSSSQDGLPSPSGTMDLSKSSNPNQVRNRKGSLSAIVDKLKSAAHCDTTTDLSGKSSVRDRTGQSNSGKSSDSSKSTNKVGETKNSEYMVKSSSDGIKITINKTRTKESSKTKSSISGTGSPKTHTGLKPGVNSGPASKKPQQLNQKSSTTLPNCVTSSSSYNANLKTSSSSNKTSSSSSSSAKSSLSGSVSKSSSKLSGSPKTSSSASDLSRSGKDRPKLNKSSSDKSIFSSREGRKSSPTQNSRDDDGDRTLKVNKMDLYSSPLVMDGFTKHLDKSFQIPKLSARSSDDKKISSNKTSIGDTMNNINRTVDTKVFDMLAKNDITLPKFQLPLEAKIRNSMNASPANSLLSSGSSSPKLPHRDGSLDLLDQEDKKRDCAPSLHGEKDFKLNQFNPISAINKQFSSSSSNSDAMSLTKNVDLTSKFASQTNMKDDKKDSNKIKSDPGDMLLDFSRTNKTDKVGGAYPPSPSNHIQYKLARQRKQSQD